MSDVAVDGPLANTPQPPYVAVIFTSMFTGADVEGYAAMGERMMELVRSQPGYLGVESVHDETGCGITVSYWTDLAAVANWKQHIEHLQAQQAGRSRWYSDYRLRVCEVSRATDLHGSGKSGESEPPHFAALVESRKGWIEDRLRPWCQRALRSDLLLAENEWVDIAGKADPEKTLWAWAWNRFPDLVHADLGIDETS
ncbi:MAG: antibiotic biosynthesis monooxygenase, partial [Planctomycetaceae bacterium]|nr:antibiotic biosynthesis monooxygenase [Planctomycetaceae bacterium]